MGVSRLNESPELCGINFDILAVRQTEVHGAGRRKVDIGGEDITLGSS